MDEKEERPASIGSRREELAHERRKSNVIAAIGGESLNASGHEDQLQRQYGLLSLIGLALTVDNAWVAFAGSIVISSYNGGAPGILYELITATLYYLFIGACIAELASAIPSSGGVYSWASVTGGPKYGRALGFYTGYINFFAWIFDLASINQITANVLMQMYVVYHPDHVIEPWNTYVAFILLAVIAATYCIFLNSTLPKLQSVGMFFVVVGGIITIIVLAAMPKQHASNDFVWKDWENGTGWTSGVAFLTGVLNGAFTIGTPDAITHMAEELPNPQKDLPKAVFLQIGLGGLSAFLYAVTVFYGITDFGAVLDSNGSFPIAEAYMQATGSRGATLGLLLIIFFSIMICLIGTFLTLSRIWWALARDKATPLPGLFSQVNKKLSCPIPSMIFVAIFTIALGAIPLGSTTAFADLAGSFIILSTTSFALAIGPHLFSGRKYVPPGPFWMGKAGFVVQALALLFIVFFNIMYCFPYALPVETEAMNYNSVILVGCFVLTSIWWFAHGKKHYPGPKLTVLYVEGVDKNE